MPVYFSLGTPTDQEVPVPLRGRLIPESADVGSPTWKITVHQVISHRPSVGAEHWPVHTIFPFPLTNGILTPRPAPQNSTITSFASQEQWQRRNSKSTQSLQPILCAATSGCELAAGPPQWRVKGQHGAVCTTSGNYCWWTEGKMLMKLPSWMGLAPSLYVMP